MKRKSPRRHRVHGHRRQGRWINSYIRGHGTPKIVIKKVVVKKLETPVTTKQQTLKQETKRDIPYYSRDDLEKMFLNETEQEARQQAEELGFKLEKEELKGGEGIRILHYYYPIDTDSVPGIQTPDAWRAVDLTIDLDKDVVTNVFSYMTFAPQPEEGPGI